MYCILCTGAFLYEPYSFLLISNKFWNLDGGEGVEEQTPSREVMLLDRTSAVMLLNGAGGVVWALKPRLFVPQMARA